jgi:hypothetical protein
MSEPGDMARSVPNTMLEAHAMSNLNDAHFHLVGPDVDPDPRTRRHTATMYGHTGRFTVTFNSRIKEWTVNIDGIPEPCIVHERPWLSAEEARDAAAQALRAILELEHVQDIDRGLVSPPPRGEVPQQVAIAR